MLPSSTEVLLQELTETKAELARGWWLYGDQMCRTADDSQRRSELRLLRAAISTSPADPAVRAVLDELTHEHLGWTLDQQKQNYDPATGS